MPRMYKRKYPRRARRAVPRRRSRYARKGYTQSTVHNFKRSYYKEGAFASDPTNDTFQGLVFSLQNLPSFTDFQALFDQYRINKIKMTLYPRQNVTNGQFPSPTTDIVQSCQVFSVVDYDDGNAPISLDSLLQYQNLKTTRGLRTHSRTFKPGVHLTTDNGGTTTGSVIRKSPWLDMANTLVWHNAIKLAFQNTGGFAPVTYDMKVDMWVSCKNVR